jgi:hypothetical protein
MGGLVMKIFTKYGASVPVGKKFCTGCGSPKRFAAIILLAALLLSLTACNRIENVIRDTLSGEGFQTVNPPSSEQQANNPPSNNSSANNPPSNNSSANNPPSQAQNEDTAPAIDITGLVIREPQTDEERFAMRFVEVLYTRDYDAVAALVDLEAIAPFAPMFTDVAPYIASSAARADGNWLYDTIVTACVGYRALSHSQDYSEFDFERDMEIGLGLGHIFWRRGENARSIGIANVSDLGITVVHSASNGEALVRVKVGRDANGELKIIRAPYTSAHGNFIDRSFEFNVPRGGVVTFRGEVLTPTRRSASGFQPDRYTLSGFHLGIPEEISVDMGDNFGVIRDMIYVFGDSETSSFMVLRGNYIFGETMMANLLGLAVTMPDKRDILDEAVYIFEFFSDFVFDALANGEWSDIRSMILNNGSMTRGMLDQAARSFNNWQTEEANPDRANLANVERKADILAINVLSSRSVEVNVVHSKMLNNRTYRTQLQWTLTKSDDGRWFINELPTTGVFSRSTNIWILLEE